MLGANFYYYNNMEKAFLFYCEYYLNVDKSGFKFRTLYSCYKLVYAETVELADDKVATFLAGISADGVDWKLETIL